MKDFMSLRRICFKVKKNFTYIRVFQDAGFVTKMIINSELN